MSSTAFVLSVGSPFLGSTSGTSCTSASTSHTRLKSGNNLSPKSSCKSAHQTFVSTQARQTFTAGRETITTKKNDGFSASEVFGEKSIRAGLGRNGFPQAKRAEVESEPVFVIMMTNGTGRGRTKTAIVTGASSGVGLWTAKALADQGWHVIMACRNLGRAEEAARQAGMKPDSYTALLCDLSSMSSVRQFVDNFRTKCRPLDAIVANAAVYTPLRTEPARTVDGFEENVATNHLGHFLLINLLLDDLKRSDGDDKRVVILGTVTHNPKELGGKIPPQPDLGDLRGLEKGFAEPFGMIDGKTYNGAKAYKDSKVCNILTMRELHRRYHDATGITFASLYPGCVASSGLFRQHYPLFQKLFPIFQKYITGGYVTEPESGRRVAAVVADPAFKKSGAYFSWGNRQRRDGQAFIQEMSNEALDDGKAERVWDLSARLVGIA